MALTYGCGHRKRNLMIQGTMSSAGKSLLVTGLCRIFHQDGHQVAPFKSQNMALNSYITLEGLEMGRAQVTQAEAAGIEPTVHMNPILLKPTSDMGSQVIVNGEVWKTLHAAEYYACKEQLRPLILEAYRTLEREYDVIVLEGAGSPAEINLRKNDFVNMGMAEMVDAPVLLVADIDRGGVFASIYGTVMLLAPEERARIKGVIINKFRGDVKILRPGLTQIENLIHIPVLGVVPYLHLDIDDEDSVTQRFCGKDAPAILDVAVIRFPHISNATDFNALDRVLPGCVRYVRRARELKDPDLVILPGTKSTMDDLLWMRQNGLEAAVKHYAANGNPVIGVCGGYQMLGRTLSDPACVERGGDMLGMDLLPVDTVFCTQKTRTRVTGAVQGISGFYAPLSGAKFSGYEIHMGATRSAAAFSLLSNGTADGAVSGNILGSYVHDLFDDELGHRLLKLLADRKGVALDGAPINAWQHKQRQYDLLSDALRECLDMEAIYRILEDGA